MKTDKYRISVIIGFDQEYSRGDQMENIKSEISMLIADYNCFYVIGDIAIEKLD